MPEPTAQTVSGLNLPNFLTVLRFLLVPLILLALLSPGLGWQLLGTALFILAALTDTFDGRIARRRRQVTQFGKFADPLADKLLTLTMFAIIVLHPAFASVRTWLAAWVVLIAVREIGITGLRIWALRKGSSVVTSLWGKVKTTAQLIAIIATLALLDFRVVAQHVPAVASVYPGDAFAAVTVNLLVFVCMVLTVVSGILYLVHNRLEPRDAGEMP
ncbi:MAG: CDP-diacylglycerol--glycerol-3-phosphate 3-phosphatidyltransferase [Candidatus Zixiibacteriota bacterium]|nr:MAG: CDP-diacylglycerol--glycerol-3-phosphate 3-phosphatidyltransferase [candidate division Zixibacteria bacterium]